MNRHLKKIVHYTTNGNLDKLDKMLTEHPDHVSAWLYHFAIRNNQIEVIDYLAKKHQLKFNGLSSNNIYKNNGSISVKIDTLLHLKDIFNLDYKVLTERTITVLVANMHSANSVKRIIDYVIAFKAYNPGIVNHFLSQVKLVRKSESGEIKVAIRTFVIENVLE